MRHTTRMALTFLVAMPGVLAAQGQQLPRRPMAPQGQMGPMGRMMPMGHVRGMMMHRMMSTPSGPEARVMLFMPSMLLQRRDALGLTDQQVAQLRALEQSVQAAHEKAASDAPSQQEQLMQAWNADRPDTAVLRRSARALMQTQQAAHLAALTAAAQAKGVLTPEQRGRVEGWADARMMRMRGWMQRRERRDSMPPSRPRR